MAHDDFGRGRNELNTPAANGSTIYQPKCRRLYGCEPKKVEREPGRTSTSRESCCNRMTTSLFRDLDMKLNCFVLGDQRSQVFQVEIPKTKAVISLKRAIKEKRLKNVDAHVLELYQVSIPKTDLDTKLGTFLDPANVHGAKVLSRSTARLWPLFPSPAEETIHVILAYPSAGEYTTTFIHSKVLRVISNKERGTNWPQLCPAFLSDSFQGLTLIRIPHPRRRLLLVCVILPMASHSSPFLPMTSFANPRSSLVFITKRW